MSKENPGVIFDASSSWNGYNHQGKLAILFAIKQILEVYNNTLSIDENKKVLDKYFIEIEYLEDFSIGKCDNCTVEYYNIHQVKNHATQNASDYDSALLGLAYHVQRMPSLKMAYLHVTTDVDFNGKSLSDYVKQLITCPVELNKTISRINEVRSDNDKKKELYAKHIDRPENFVSKLKKALIEVDGSQKELTLENIDTALDALEKETKKKIDAIGSMTDEQINKISLYTYVLSGTSKLYCEVNQIEELIKNEIRNTISYLALSQLWMSDKYLKQRYLFLLGKLDEHIIDRDLNYPLYKSGKINRKIKLSVIYDWLTCSEIENVDDYFFQFQLKDIFASISNKFCERCGEGRCDNCLMTAAVNKIGQMSFDEMKQFICLTSPNNGKGLSVATISNYMSSNHIANPFLKGIRDITKPFEPDKHAITYIDEETVQYVLTTIVLEELLEDTTSICSDIVSNKDLYELLMDYDCFISRDVACSSILSEAMKIGKRFTEDNNSENRKSEHIAHLKDVSIIKLTDFISKI